MPTDKLLYSMLAFLVAFALGTTSTAYAQYDCAGQNEVAVQDCEALIALHQATTVNDPWDHASGFGRPGYENVPVSQWATRDPVLVENGRVAHVNLWGNNLNGTLPDAICDLEALRELDLDYNELTGTIPACIGDMAALEKLSVRQVGYDLEGSLPESLGELINLKELNLAGNLLTGPIPASLGNLVNLEMLVLGGSQGLAGNQLDGDIPESLGQLTKLTILTLRGNRLTGSIPASLGNLTDLIHLGLDSNDLTGSIPASLGNMTNLESLGLAGNALTDFEAGSYDWNSLQIVRLNANDLTNLPDLSGLSAPSYINVSYNHLTFGDLEPLAGLVGNPALQYFPQYSIPLRQTIEDGNTVLWLVAGGGDATTYDWRRRDLGSNGVFMIIEGETGPSYVVTESGQYVANARNPAFPDLTVSGKAVDVEIDGCPVGKTTAGCGFVVNMPGDTGFPPDDAGDPALPEDGICDLDPETEGEQCSLRAALQLANGGFGGDGQAPVVIAFAIPGDATIHLVEALPEIQKPIEIDGTTQAAGLVHIDGQEVEGSAAGLLIGTSGSGSTMKGLIVEGFEAGAGIVLTSSSNNTIEGCIIVRNKAGIIVGNSGDVGPIADPDSKENTIQSNVIGGNDFVGIGLVGGAIENTVTANLVGTESDGRTALGNGIGILVESNETSEFIYVPRRNIIQNNVISNNRNGGITLQGLHPRSASQAPPEGNIIEANKIGTDLTGSEALPNATAGLSLIRSTKTEVRDNVIAGNQGAGLRLTGAIDSIIEGNKIGTDATGTAPLGNDGHGIVLEGKSTNNTMQGNTISSNQDSGVFIERHANVNSLVGNAIGTDLTGTEPLGNGEHGIEIERAAGTRIVANVISGNTRNGLFLSNRASAVILNNLIGTSVDGTAPLGNRGHGLFLDGVERTYIQQNLISANRESGLYVTGRENNQLYVRFNKVGTDINEADILGVMGNRAHGVVLDRTGGDVTIESNRIAYNHGAGVRTVDVDTRDAGIVRNTIRRNIIGVQVEQGGGSIFSNVIERNIERGIDALDGVRDLLIKNNTVRQNGGISTGIHLTDANAVIEGNTIIDDAGDAITLEQGSTAIITHNNLFGNAGMGLNNLTPSVMVSAPDNWWGDASGPGGEGPGGGDEVSDGVDVSGWLGEMVAVVVSAERDEILLPVGEPDTVSVFVQNWQVRDDALDLTISDTEGWLQSPTALTVPLDDSTGAEVHLAGAVPPGTPNGATSTVEVTATSQADHSHTATTTFTLRAESAALAQVLVVPGTVEVTPGDTVLFDALGLDQFNRTVAFTPTWSATGGVIDTSGAYVAGATAGAFIVTATDPATGLSGTARVGNGVPVAVEDAGETPDDFRLGPNYPNPFNPETVIPFTLPQRARIHLAVYDVLGRTVAVLVDDTLQAGTHQARFDARSLTSGVYVYRLTADRFSQTRTMVLLR